MSQCPSYSQSQCLRCEAEIIHTRFVISNATIDLHAAPEPDGNIVIRNNRAHVLRKSTPTQPDELRYVAHHERCTGWREI